MKFLTICLLLLIALGCEPVRDVSETSENPIYIYAKSPENAQKVTLYFRILSDYEGSEVVPDSVTMDGNSIQEGRSVSVGSHKFTVERRAYKKSVLTVDVHDDDNDGSFYLNAKLEAAERLIRFDITGKDGKVIEAKDLTITVSPIGEPTKKIISDHSTLKPGLKTIVIQCNGYQTKTDDAVNISPDEQPYFLRYTLTPE